jgi:riboflavin kinase/FMN adenylyltransferase
MNVVSNPSDLRVPSGKVCVAIGVFDGVHLGHQQVIRQTISDAREYEATPVIITFDRHPSAVVAPARTPPLIYRLPRKLEVIASLGVDTTWLIHFDEAFSEIPAEVFVRNLVRDFGRVCSISVGANFTFGYKRSGDVSLLKRMGEEQGFRVHGLAAVALDGVRVSSTRIREAILAGALDSANQMLGRPYDLSGEVVRGDQVGRKLGFPTANIAVDGLVVPPKGVYAVHVTVGQKKNRGVLNIGVRPTLSHGVSQLRVEAHLLDFSEDIYGQVIQVTFAKRLREEQKFSSLDALREQIATDVASARCIFG